MMNTARQIQILHAIYWGDPAAAEPSQNEMDQLTAEGFLHTTGELTDKALQLFGPDGRIVLATIDDPKGRRETHYQCGCILINGRMEPCERHQKQRTVSA